MNYDDTGVRCTMLRGGTSRGLYFEARDLPADAAARDDLLLRLMGTPDPRQIDGLGHDAHQQGRGRVAVGFSRGRRRLPRRGRAADQRTQNRGNILARGGARVTMDAPARYAKQLIGRTSRRLTWRTDDAVSTTAIGDGLGTVVIWHGVLNFRAEDPDDATMARIRDVVGDNMEHFGQRKLAVAWESESP